MSYRLFSCQWAPEVPIHRKWLRAHLRVHHLRDCLLLGKKRHRPARQRLLHPVSPPRTSPGPHRCCGCRSRKQPLLCCPWRWHWVLLGLQCQRQARRRLHHQLPDPGSDHRPRSFTLTSFFNDLWAGGGEGVNPTVFSRGLAGDPLPRRRTGSPPPRSGRHQGAVCLW